MSLSDLIFEKAPWWIAIFVLTIIGIFRYGPKFLREWGNTLREIKKKGLHSEYITDLKMQRDRLQKENDLLREKLEKYGTN